MTPREVPRFHATPYGNVQFTEDEEEQWDIFEAAEAVKAAAYKATEYQRQRADEYPPMSDYLDGIVKGDEQQVSDYIAACLAVKAKYPKPQPI